MHNWSQEFATGNARLCVQVITHRVAATIGLISLSQIIVCLKKKNSNKTFNLDNGYLFFF